VELPGRLADGGHGLRIAELLELRVQSDSERVPGRTEAGEIEVALGGEVPVEDRL